MIPNTIFAAIDIETTGLDVELHEILDIAIVPLNEDFTISATMPEFTARVRAEHPETATVEALRVNGLNPAEGKNKKEVADEFRQWLFDCGIEKIIPIAHNLDFDMRFIFRAFPAESKVFSRHGRDSMRVLSSRLGRCQGRRTCLSETHGTFDAGVISCAFPKYRTSDFGFNLNRERENHKV